MVVPGLSVLLFKGHSIGLNIFSIYIHIEHNILKVQDIDHMAILKFYSKLINDNLPNYFKSFTPQFSAGQQHYNF